MTETQSFKGEWLSSIPVDWAQKKIKHVFNIRKVISGELGHDVISITQLGAKIKDIESGEGQISMDYSKYQFVRYGDFLMNHMDLLTGYVDIAMFDGVTSPDYRVFELKDKKSLPKYHLYLFQHCYKSKVFYGYGRGSSQLGRWRFSTVEFENFYVPVPSYEEQKLISHYLDKKTEQIDSLIGKIQNKIELLREQRTSLIHHYVTKGLNPTIEMKDSGLEWVGKIPKHWDFRKLKHFYSFKKGSMSQKLTSSFIYENSGEHPVYSGQTSNDGILGTWNEYEFDFDTDVIFCTTVGAKLMTTRVLSGKFSLSQNCLIMIPKHISISSRFINYFFKYDFSIRKELLPSILQPSLRIEDLDQYRIPVPPLEEQIKITDYVGKYCISFDEMISKLTHKTDLLKEYRQSLISSVVTGKVRVTEGLI